MKIGTIGAGNVGATLVRRLSVLGHQISVANSRGPETLKRVAEETGASASTIEQVARDNEVVVITIPQGRVRSLPKTLFDQAKPGLVIVDTGNYYPNGNADYGREADGFIEEIENGMPESRWVETQLTLPVVKAFNTIVAADLMDRGKPKKDPARVALPIAGDDPTTKAVVALIIDELGFDTLDVGGLSESWRHQPGTPVYCQNLRITELRNGLQQANPVRQPEWRASK